MASVFESRFERFSFGFVLLRCIQNLRYCRSNIQINVGKGSFFTKCYLNNQITIGKTRLDTIIISYAKTMELLIVQIQV